METIMQKRQRESNMIFRQIPENSSTGIITSRLLSVTYHQRSLLTSAKRKNFILPPPHIIHSLPSSSEMLNLDATNQIIKQKPEEILFKNISHKTSGVLGECHHLAYNALSGKEQKFVTTPFIRMRTQRVNPRKTMERVWVGGGG